MIYLINGPAGSGKDTLGEYLASRYDGTVTKLARPLYEALSTLTGETVDDIARRKPESIIPGAPTRRQMLIDLSESYIKPRLGVAWFPRLLVRHIEKFPLVKQWFVTDCGFQVEVDFLFAYYGYRNVRLIQLRRPGHDFNGDSREYVFVPKQRLMRTIYNDGSLDEFYDKGNIAYNELRQEP